MRKRAIAIAIAIAVVVPTGALAVSTSAAASSLSLTGSAVTADNSPLVVGDSTEIGERRPQWTRKPTPTRKPTNTPAPTATPATATFNPMATQDPTNTPAPTATPAATPVPTAAPTAGPTADPTAAPTADPTAAPTATPVLGTVTVSSIPALLTALADNSVDKIVVANGTYHVSPASYQRADSLWIGAKFAGRTRPVTVMAQTTGGVTFDGGGETYFGGLSFEAGAHDQTWQGFVFAHGTPTQTGVITFGGYAGLAAPHHITLRAITIARTITSTYAGSEDQSIYFSEAVGGPHNILIDGYAVNGAGGVNTALTFYHSDGANQNAWNVTVRNMAVTGTYEAVEIWDPTAHQILIENSTITNARNVAVRFEQGTGITLTNITSTGSGSGQGFYSSQGATPAGVAFSGDSFH